ncbi:hypothetical protein GCM10022209_34650 [Chitinophaga oryziterrae]
MRLEITICTINAKHNPLTNSGFCHFRIIAAIVTTYYSTVVGSNPFFILQYCGKQASELLQ